MSFLDHPSGQDSSVNTDPASAVPTSSPLPVVPAPPDRSRTGATGDRGPDGRPRSASSLSVRLTARFYRAPHAAGTTATALQSGLLTAAAAIVLDAGPAAAADWLWWIPVFALVSAILMAPLTALWFSSGLLLTAVSARRGEAGRSAAESPPFRRLAEHGKARVRALTAFWRKAYRVAAGLLLSLGAAFLAMPLLDAAAWPGTPEAHPFTESAPAFLALPLFGWPALAAAVLLVATVLDRCAGAADGPLRRTLLDRARRRLPLLAFTPALLFLAAWVLRGSPWPDGFSGRVSWLAVGAVAAPWIALAALPALGAALLLGWLLLAAGDGLLRFGKRTVGRRDEGSRRTSAAPGKPFRAWAAPFLEGDPHLQATLTLAASCLLVALLGATFDLWPSDYAHWFWAIPFAGLLAAGVCFPLMTATGCAVGLLLTLVDAGRGLAPRRPADESPPSRPPAPTREHFRLLRAASRARSRATRESSAAIGLFGAALLALGGTTSFAIFSFRAVRTSDPALSAGGAVALTAILLVVLFLLLVMAFVAMKTAMDLIERLGNRPAMPREPAGAPRRSPAEQDFRFDCDPRRDAKPNWVPILEPDKTPEIER